jgi:phosphatidylinositol alpha-1,6-mannosyltransferase
VKVLLLSPSLDATNGWGRFTGGLATALERTGASVDVLLPRDAGEVHTTLTARRALPDLDLRFRRPDVVWRARHARLPRDGARGDGFVYCVDGFPMAIFGHVLARRLGRPYVVGTQGTYGVAPLDVAPARRTLARAFAAARAVVAPSRHTADAIRARTAVEPVVIRNAVDTEWFTPGSPTGAFRPPGAPGRFVLSVAPAKPRKGLDVSLRAFAAIAGRFPDVDYVVIGPEPGASPLVGLARDAGIAGRVHFAGRVSDEELLDAYRACELLVHTPRDVDGNFEGFGLVYCEAGACAKPVVAARSGGTEDAVLDGQTGLVVPEGDVAQTARALSALLSDADLRARLGARGRDHAEEHSWPRYARELLAAAGAKGQLSR